MPTHQLAISQLLQQPSGLMPCVERDFGSTGSHISNMMSSGWGVGFSLLFLLPFVGALIRPFMRLGTSSLNGVSTIASALIFCVSSWMVTLIEYITLIGRALRPSPRVLPVIKVVVAIATVANVWTTASIYASKAHGKISLPVVLTAR
jgi:hypothetical protein